MTHVTDLMREIGELLGEVSWPLILIICLLGGVLALLGDRLGMKVAKKKVTLFGLRPRHTSSIITALTGLGIALLVLTSLALTSDTVRTALFSMQYLKKQTLDLTAQLQTSQQEQQLAELNLTSAQTQLIQTQTDLAKAQAEVEAVKIQAQEAQNQLKEAQQKVAKAQAERKALEGSIKTTKAQLEELRTQQTELEAKVKGLTEDLQDYQQGDIIVAAGETLAQVSIDSDDKTQIMDSLQEGIQEARALLARRQHTTIESVDLTLSDEQWTHLVEQAMAIKGRKAFYLRAAENVTAGGKVLPTMTLVPSALVYHTGQELASAQATLPMTATEAQSFLNRLLTQVKVKAKHDGLIGDPHKGTVGEVDASQYYRMVSSLQNGKGTVTVKALAKDDTYTEQNLWVEMVEEGQ